MEKVVLYVFALVISCAVMCGIGFLFSWVLAFFGLVVPWSVCAVAWFLLLCILNALRGGK